MPALKKTDDRWQASTDIVFGFGPSKVASTASAEGSLKTGYDKVLATYNGEGDAVGWEDYLSGLDQLKTLREHSTDNGHLLHVSALVLKAQEDKTHWGALIASLSSRGEIGLARKHRQLDIRRYGRVTSINALWRFWL